MFVNRLTMPNERKVFFSYGGFTSNACLLKSCNINFKTKKYVVYDGSFSCIASVVDVSVYKNSHSTEVLNSQLNS